MQGYIHAIEDAEKQITRLKSNRRDAAMLARFGYGADVHHSPHGLNRLHAPVGGDMRHRAAANSESCVGRGGCPPDDIRSPACFLSVSVTQRKTRMKTADLIDHVSSEASLEKSAAKKALEAVLASIVDAAKKGEEVNLPGFGRFKVKDSPARQGRNPATGETIEIAASKKLGFSPAKQVKDALAG
jgi:DNA-binding protein HU-beta